MKNRSMSLALCGVFAFAMATQAAVISVNFAESGEANQDLDAGTAAGLYPRDNWNNVTGNTGSENSLNNSGGSATTADVSWNSVVTWRDDAAIADADADVGDAQVARGYLDDGDTGGGIGATITVSDIPYATYTVVVLFSTDVSSGTYNPAIINGVTNSTTGGKYQYDNPNWMDYNTIAVTGLTTNNLTISVLVKDGINRGSVAGIQIVESSEGAPPAEPAVAPQWSVGGLVGEGRVGELFAANLAPFAYDRNNDPITFSKTIGPPWLAVPGTGETTGTPGEADVGTNDFVIAATDGITGSSEIPLTMVIALGVPTPVFFDDFDDYAIENDFTGPEGGWTTVIDTALGMGTTVANSIFWGNGDGGGGEAALEYNHTTPLAEGDTITLDANVTRGGGAYGYTMSIILWDGTNQGSRTTIAGGVQEVPAVGLLTQISHAVTAGEAGQQVIFKYSHSSGWCETDWVSCGIIGVAVPDAVTDLVIAGPITGGTQMILSWTGQAGFDYTVQTNSNLIIADWQDFTGSLSGTTGPMSATNTIGSDQTFYRVITE